MKAAPWRPGPVERALAHALGGGPDLAFVVGSDAVRFARAGRPVFALVNGVWQVEPGMARARLRDRLLTPGPIDEVDRAIAQVCAKRVVGGVEPEAGAHAELPLVDVGAASREADARHRAASAIPAPADVRGMGPEALAELLAALAPRDADLPDRARDRPVAALLVGPGGEVLEAARNTNGSHRVRHAEVNLLGRWENRGNLTIPAGSTVLVGVQCCRMCAALLVAAGASDVRYARPEPGRFGTHTALQDRGLERPLAP